MIKIFLRFAMKALFRVEVSGDVSVFDNPKTLIVANHESFIDGLLIGLFLPVDAVFIVHTQIANRPLFRLMLRFVNHLAVDSTSPLAMKLIVKLVETGQPVVIFPEGRITKTGSLMKVYDGAAFVAAKTGATVVPVRIDGAAQSYFGRLAGVYPRKAFPKVSISIQPRHGIAMPDLPSAKLRRRRAGELMRRILLDMLVATRPQRTLFDAFLDARETFGAQYKLVEDVRLQEESYGSLLRMSLGIQRLMSRLTVRDEVVGILTPNAAPTLGLVLALSAGKRIPAMLNYTAGPDGLRAACTAADIKTIVASRAFLEKAHLTSHLTLLVEQLPGITVHYLEDLKSQIGLSDKLWILWHLRFPRCAALPQTPDDPAIVLFTSGSEGKPKGVVHSHASLLSNVAQVRAVADFTPLDKFMMALPLFHSFGLTCGVMLPLVSGCKVFLYPSPLHYRVIPEIVYDRDCTVLFGTSTFLGHYGKYAHPYDFGRLRYVVAGAEKLSEDVRKLWIDKFGIRILEGYGVTECAPVVAVNVPMACRIGSVGQMLPGMEVELEPVPGIEQGGALHVKGPNVMKGYFLFDQPGVIQPPKSVGPGWYSTGDIVTIDDDDFVHICGRLKRFAKIAGEMVSLEVVEKIAATAAPGFAHAASTRGDAAKGEAVVLFTTAPQLTRDLLVAAAKRTGSPELAVPRVIRQVEEIPLLGSGKTDYVRLKSMAEDVH
jgi:acyl-[acyl-carrier-protein]-phospholipid O-acyltransferase/long-chain-fatty-acid--[acyl-carrier-protein] ligase